MKIKQFVHGFSATNVFLGVAITNVRLAVFFVALGLTACVSSPLGLPVLPATFAEEAVRYNEMYATAANQQLLLNILRSRDRMPRQYVALGQTATGRTLRTDASLNPTIPFGGDAASSFALGTGASHSAQSNPNLTIVPQTGSEFVKRLHQPLAAEVFQYYWNSGWPKDILLMLFVTNIRVTETGGDGPDQYRLIAPHSENSCLDKLTKVNLWSVNRQRADAVEFLGEFLTANEPTSSNKIDPVDSWNEYMQQLEQLNRGGPTPSTDDSIKKDFDCRFDAIALGIGALHRHLRTEPDRDWSSSQPAYITLWRTDNTVQNGSQTLPQNYDNWFTEGFQLKSHKVDADAKKCPNPNDEPVAPEGEFHFCWYLVEEAPALSDPLIPTDLRLTKLGTGSVTIEYEGWKFELMLRSFDNMIFFLGETVRPSANESDACVGSKSALTVEKDREGRPVKFELTPFFEVCDLDAQAAMGKNPSSEYYAAKLNYPVDRKTYGAGIAEPNDKPGDRTASVMTLLQEVSSLLQVETKERAPVLVRTTN